MPSAGGPPPFRTPFTGTGGLVEPQAWQRFLIDLQGGIVNSADSSAHYVVLTATPGLPNAQNLGLLTDGFMFLTVLDGGATITTRQAISYAPLALGIEPLTFVSTGEGEPVMVPFTP